MKKRFWVLGGLWVRMILLTSSVYGEEEIVVKEGDFWVGYALPRINCQGKGYPLVNVNGMNPLNPGEGR